ncbi:exosome complex exonuclease RRP42 [Biomphalaria pfeifferi]|uniref:Ribosomal RNA-processing protein 42 n=1 Tax=Biomphalaria pfeifferi TaxID=112525 RepID=A0AAD8BU01_BIOPF|nr:exosome complex exonuclease RRP42 [Biomphalaria pfeifferi]
MADVDLSEPEKVYILHSVQENLREDGRGCEDFRHMEVETGLISNTNGSARVRLASTDVLVGIKVQLTPVDPKKPNVGRIEFFLDCSANATPAFEGRGGEGLASEITAMLTRSYSCFSAIDYTSLCLLPGQQCWLLYIDILLLECGGNLFDAVSLAVKAALFNLRIPNVTMTKDEGGIELDVSDDPFDFKRLDVSGSPVIVTVNKIGHQHVVDASEKEEACSLAKVMLGITEKGTVTAMKKEGSGSLDSESISEMIESAKKVGIELNKCLLNILKEEEAKIEEPVGFLR